VRIAVLGASGATGRELTRQALERGHDVVAVSRHPEGLGDLGSERLVLVAADVLDPAAVAGALAGAEAIVSGLGQSSGDRPGVLAAGATAAVAAGTGRVVWLGALGTGGSARAAGALTRTLLRAFMRAELPDKAAADRAVLAAGGTVFHAGPMSGAPVSPARRTVELDGVPRRVFPASVGRATVAAAMLDEAERPRHAGRIVVPLSR
jgi:uncharacterized protein